MKKQLTTLRSLRLNIRTNVQKLALAAAIIAGTGGTSLAQGSLSTGLIHHYCLDANANDGVGANHGTVVGAVPAPDRFGTPNMAYLFDGLDDYIDLPDDVWVSGDFTVSGWLEVTAFQAWQRFFEFGNGASSDNVFYTPNQYVATDVDIYKVHRNACATSTSQVTGTVFPISTGSTWVFVTVVQRGTIGEIYRNGSLISSATVNPPCGVVRTENFFGRSNFANPYFKGRMDDIRIYNRALSANEIGTLTQTNICESIVLPSNCSDTCYWRVEGNNILAPGRNILGTLSKDDVRLFTDNTARGIYTSGGDFGWNTMTPTAKLHVDVSGLGTTSGIRFEGLPAASDADVITVDVNGNLHTRTFTGGGSLNSCATVNMLPKTSTVTGDMVCSQVFDNGTSVGIGTIGGFTYTSLAGGRLGTIVPPAAGIVRFEVNGVGRSLANIVTSDGKFKSNVNDIPEPIEIIKSITGKTYTWNSTAQQTLGADNGLHIGYIAQELQKVIPQIVMTDNEGNLGVNYTEIIPILSEAIKEQQQQIEELKSMIQTLTQSISTNGATAPKDAFLDQNVPNPFSVSTIIRYKLPAGTQKAAIGVYDMNGKEVKLFPLSSATNGSVTIQAGDLMPGMYVYTLVVDGKYFDSKKMVLTSQ